MRKLKNNEIAVCGAIFAAAVFILFMFFIEFMWTKQELEYSKGEEATIAEVFYKVVNKNLRRFK